MPRFALIYRNAQPPKNPEDGQQHMVKWRAWSSGLGGAMIEPGMPFSNASVVSQDGAQDYVDQHSLNGVSIVEATDLAAAQGMAASCPHLNMGGDIVVAEGMDMEM
ncbi:MAG: hypothetical protein ABJP48_12085 [Erythrobacter sp.]